MIWLLGWWDQFHFWCPVSDFSLRDLRCTCSRTCQIFCTRMKCTSPACAAWRVNHPPWSQSALSRYRAWEHSSPISALFSMFSVCSRASNPLLYWVSAWRHPNHQISSRLLLATLAYYDCRGGQSCQSATRLFSFCPSSWTAFQFQLTLWWRF